MKTSIWLIFGILCLLWTGTAVTTLQLMEWVFAQWSATDLSGAVAVLKDAPAWLSVWVDPVWLETAHQALVALGQGLGQFLPAGSTLMSWITPLVWVVWGLGAALLLALALVLHFAAHHFTAATRRPSIHPA